MSELSPFGGSEGYGACGDDVSDGVLFSGEKYPKAAGKKGSPRKAERLSWGEEPQRNE